MDLMTVPADGRWSEAIHLQLDQLGNYRGVGSSREALEVLTHSWPVDGGDKCILAIFPCRKCSMEIVRLATEEVIKAQERPASSGK
jgi:hypothetical protein